jgi:hypothetical protein
MVHLGALLEGLACPPERTEMGVLVDVGGRRLCLEIDEADSVLYERGLPVQAGTTLPWAAGVARTTEGLIPLLDLAALGARFSEVSAA